MSMNVFELFAKLGLDTSEYDKGLSNAAAEGKSFGSKFTSAIGAAAKGATVAIGAAATAAAGLAKASVDGFSEAQQLEGGIETLFGAGGRTLQQFVKDEVAAGKTAEEATRMYNGLMKAQEMVFDNAKNAYKEAGMSANEYMENVAGFAAALVDSAGRGDYVDVDELKEQQKEELRQYKRSLQDQYDATKESWDERIKLVDSKDKALKESLRNQKADELKALKRANEDQLVEYKNHQKEVIAETEAANTASEKTPESMVNAAKLADTAMKDISDNANKMGTSMESVQNAYQGFAKQNYTMLDNLKLGYGGTKEEMQRLLQNAEKLTGKAYSIGKFSDIVEAIHAIQVEMGIAGTTTHEAAHTITGSIGQMRAAWKNLVVGFADKDADLGELISFMVDSAEVAFENLLPVAEHALLGVADFVEKITPLIADKLPGIFDKLFPAVMKAATGLLRALFRSLPSVLKTIAGQIPVFTKAFSDLMIIVATGLKEALPTLIPVFSEAIVGIIVALSDPQVLGVLIEAGTEIIKAIIKGLEKAAPTLLEALFTIIGNLTDIVSDASPALKGFLALFASVKILNGIKSVVSAVTAFKGEISSLKGNIETAKTALKGMDSIAGKLGTNLGSIDIGGMLGVANGTTLAQFFTTDMTALVSSGAVSMGTAIAAELAAAIVAAFAGAEVGKAIGGMIFPEDKELYEQYSGIEGTLRMIADSVKAIFVKDDGEKTGLQTLFDLNEAKATLSNELGFTNENAYAKAIEYMNQNLEFTHEMMTSLQQDFGLTAEQMHNLNLVNLQIRQINNGQREDFNATAKAILDGSAAIGEAAKQTEALSAAVEKEPLSNLVPYETFMVMDDLQDKVGETDEAVENAFDSEKYSALGEEATALMSEKFTLGLATIADAFNVWGEEVGGAWAEILDGFSTKFDLWVEEMNTKFETMQSNVDALCGGIKTSVEELMKWLQENVKLPHFSIDGDFDLENKKAPEVNVEWYSKAMDNAMLLKNPTIFGAAGGRLLGAGESGSEVVSGASTLMNMINRAVNESSEKEVTIVIELDKDVLGKSVYKLYNDQSRRVGTRLAYV